MLLGSVFLGIINIHKAITIGEITFCGTYGGCGDVLYEENPVNFLFTLGLVAFLSSSVLYLYYWHFFKNKRTSKRS